MDLYTLRDEAGQFLRKSSLLTGMFAFTVAPVLSNGADYGTSETKLSNNSKPKEIMVSAPDNDLTKNIESYIGVPVEGDYDDDPDLDFRMQFVEEGKLFDVYVHEDADKTNIANLNKVREIVEDARMNEGFIYVRGKLKEKGPERFDEKAGQIVQWARINPFYVGSVDMESGETKPIFTESTSSELYKADDYVIEYVLWEPSPVRIIWSRDWHHYPYSFTPSWDWDGDGIPNWRDPVPTMFGPYTDLNHNGIIDAWDITAPGYWGWYGFYWHHYYPDYYWWHIHDHWHSNNGWNNYYYGHRESRGGSGSGSKSIQRPIKNYDGATRNSIEAQRQKHKKPKEITRGQNRNNLEDNVRKEKYVPQSRKEYEYKVPSRADYPKRTYDKPKNQSERKNMFEPVSEKQNRRYSPVQTPVESRREFNEPSKKRYTPPRRDTRIYNAPSKDRRNSSFYNNNNDYNNKKSSFQRQSNIKRYTPPKKNRSSQSFDTKKRTPKSRSGRK